MIRASGPCGRLLAASGLLLLLLVQCACVEATTAQFSLNNADLSVQLDQAGGRIVVDGSDLSVGNMTLSALASLATSQQAHVASAAQQIVDITSTVAHAPVGDVSITASGGYSTMPFTAVYGVLNISAYTGSSVPPMPYLTTVFGSIFVQNNPSLSSLVGLDSVSSIAGSLVIQHNAQLSTLVGLGHLSSLGSGIISNNALLDMTGLNLTTIEAAFTISAYEIYGSNDGRFQWQAVPCPVATADAFVVCENLHSLNGLQNLQTVQGNMAVKSSNFRALDGLNALVTVNGSFTITSNSLLHSTSDLQALSYIAGELSVSSNAVLQTVELQSIEVIDDDISISCMGSLSTITFPLLSRVGGTISVAADIASYQTIFCPDGCGSGNPYCAIGTVSLNFPNLELVSNQIILQAQIEGMAFGKLTQIAQGLSIQVPIANMTAFPALRTAGGLMLDGGPRSLAGLESLTSVTGDLVLYQNGITDLSPLRGLLNVTGGIHINEPGVSDLSAFSQLPQINGLFLYNSSLANFTSLALPNGSTINDALVIGGGPFYMPSAILTPTCALHISVNLQLTSLAGLENLTTVNGPLYVCSNGNLLDVSALSSLTTVTGPISITQPIGNLSVLSNLDRLNGLSLQNTNLTDLQTLTPRNLSAINGVLYLYANNQLANLTGLEPVTTIAGSPLNFEYPADLTGVEISNNPALTSLAGLGNLTSVTGAFTISSNAKLTDISALSRVTKIAGVLTVSGNSLLSVCESLQASLNRSATSVSWSDVTVQSSC